MVSIGTQQGELRRSEHQVCPIVCSVPYLTSDMTLNVGGVNMPMIRPPNFGDITVDMPIDKITVVVGNQAKGKALERISLRTYLENIGLYTGNDKLTSLYRDRDAQLLASAQACILPLSDGQVSFHVALFNYQSEANDPAVLTLVSSSTGTSCQVVDRNTTALYFNDAGNAVDFVAKRVSDDRVERNATTPVGATLTDEEKSRNSIMVIQVPLVTKPRPRRNNAMYMMECCSVAKSCDTRSASTRGMEDAMISKGTVVKGKYEGTRDLKLERDDRFPIRVTIQFYKVTDTAEVRDADLEQIALRHQTIYSHGSSQSSLVTATTNRPTETTGVQQVPAFPLY